jgi:hypothetical protein
MELVIHESASDLRVTATSQDVVKKSRRHSKRANAPPLNHWDWAVWETAILKSFEREHCSAALETQAYMCQLQLAPQEPNCSQNHSAKLDATTTRAHHWTQLRVRDVPCPAFGAWTQLREGRQFFATSLLYTPPSIGEAAAASSIAPGNQVELRQRHSSSTSATFSQAISVHQPTRKGPGQDFCLAGEA